MIRPGRPKGSQNRATMLKRNVAEEILERCKTDGTPTPLEFLTEQMLNDKNPMILRTDCAKAAAPYLHRKQPQAIDGGEDKPISVMNLSKLSELPDEQLEQFIKIAGQLADDGGAEGGEGTAPSQLHPDDVPGHGGPTP